MWAEPLWSEPPPPPPPPPSQEGFGVGLSVRVDMIGGGVDVVDHLDRALELAVLRGQVVRQVKPRHDPQRVELGPERVDE